MKTKERHVAQALLPVSVGWAALSTGKSACATPEPGSAPRGGSTLKLNERTENVYENKGPLWKTLVQSLYVFENTLLILIMSVCY